jgi:2-isopropylmalate synthase
MPSFSELIATWNPAPSPHLVEVDVEDDSLRDGLQGAFVRKPSVEQKISLLRLSAAVGCHAAMIAFPASSQEEFDACTRMVRAIDEEKLGIVPRCLARALPKDVASIAEINANAECDVWADFFVGTSPLRGHIENWNLPDILGRIDATAKALVQAKTHFGISIEDATRTPPDRYAEVFRTAVLAGAEIVTVCDTVGEATPAGAKRLVEFSLEVADKAGVKPRIWWHGHNDRGLATANALAAAEAGAHVISGAFGGIGERTGNTALEQAVMFLHQAGSKRFRVDKIVEYCTRLAELTETPIPENAPLIGRQAFATSTGTHSAAVLKARALGIEFEDYVFSAIPASALGRGQDILIGPTSGLANARYMLAQLGLPSTEENAASLLAYAKTQDKWLMPDGIRASFKGGDRK